MSVNKPKISIITAVFNNEKFLEKSINSVLSQTYENIEYIIIDGGSTDGTLDIIKKYDDRIDYWVSEKDSGVYDALNKALRVCKGEYICVLNGDDYYKKHALEKSLGEIEKTNSDYCIANARFVNAKSVMKPIFPLKEGFIYQEMPYPHVSLVAKKEIYEKVGFFDTSFKIAGDHDMALRIHLAGFRACYLDEVVALLEPDGISSSTKSMRESRDVAIKNGKPRTLACKTFFVQFVKFKLYQILPEKVIQYVQSIKKSRFM